MDHYNFPLVIAEKAYKVLPACIVKKIQPKLMSLVAKKLHNTSKGLNYIDINVVDHCNLKCKYCSNFCPIASERFLELEEYNSDMERLAYLSGVKIKTIRLLGGEPLLHPRLLNIITITRKHFHYAGIDLVTNGILLNNMPGEFWQKCKDCNVRIAISHYPIKLNYAKIKKNAKKYGVKTAYGKKARNMYKWVLDLEGTQDVNESYAYCFRSTMCTVLQNGKIYACSLPPWIKYFNEFFNKNLVSNEADYKDIYKTDNFDEILEFLNKPIPFCKYCKTKNISFANRWDISQKEISEWT